MPHNSSSGIAAAAVRQAMQHFMLEWLTVTSSDVLPVVSGRRAWCMVHEALVVIISQQSTALFQH